LPTHAMRRAIERTGFNHSLSERIISKAIEKGKPSDGFKGNERRYLQSKEAKGQCETRVYLSFIFIVDTAGFCVSMYPTPDWFGKKKHFNGKVKINNPRKYPRYYIMFNEDVAYHQMNLRYKA